MKRTLSLLVFCLSFAAGYSQVFNTGIMMPPGRFAIGLEPTYLVNSSQGKLFLFIHGNYGLKSDVGLNFQVGVGGYDTYGGAAVNWGFSKMVNLTAGAHYFGNFGLDGRLNFNFQLQRDARLFTGIDANINFAQTVQVPLWLPVGIEIKLPDRLSFILEAEIALTRPAYHIIGGGVAYYF